MCVRVPEQFAVFFEESYRFKAGFWILLHLSEQLQISLLELEVSLGSEQEVFIGELVFSDFSLWNKQKEYRYFTCVE